MQKESGEEVRKRGKGTEGRKEKREWTRKRKEERRKWEEGNEKGCSGEKENV